MNKKVPAHINVRLKPVALSLLNKAVRKTGWKPSSLVNLAIERHLAAYAGKREQSATA